VQCSKSIPKQAASSTRISVSTTGRSPSPNSSNATPFNENEVLAAQQAILMFLALLFYYSVNLYLYQITQLSFCSTVVGEV
jgi:hypothetical protein